MPVFGALMGLFLLSGAPASAAAPGVPELPTYSVTLTGYNALAAQTDDDPFITASGSYANPEVVAARSRDLAAELPFGTIIKVVSSAAQNPDCGFDSVAPLIGYRVIADTMNERIHNHIDVLFGNGADVALGKRMVNPANALGACENVTVSVVGYVDITHPSHMPQTQADILTLLNKTNLALQ